MNLRIQVNLLHPGKPLVASGLVQLFQPQVLLQSLFQLLQQSHMVILLHPELPLQIPLQGLQLPPGHAFDHLASLFQGLAGSQQLVTPGNGLIEFILLLPGTPCLIPIKDKRRCRRRKQGHQQSNGICPYHGIEPPGGNGCRCRCHLVGFHPNGLGMDGHGIGSDGRSRHHHGLPILIQDIDHGRDAIEHQPGLADDGSIGRLQLFPQLYPDFRKLLAGLIDLRLGGVVLPSKLLGKAYPFPESIIG